MPSLLSNPSDQPLVSAEILLGCDTAARALGVELDPLLREHDIDPDLVRQPSGYLEHAAVTQFLQAAESSLGIDTFGFVLGTHQPPLKLGPIAAVMAASPTVGKALKNGMRLHPMFSEGSTHELVVKDGTARLSRWSTVPYDFATTQMRMLGIVMIYRVTRSLAGDDWRPGQVWFSFREPADAKPMMRYFGCPVLFDQPSDALVFPASDLDIPVRSADSAVLELLMGQLEPLLDRRADRDTLLLRAESYIRQTMGTRRCNLESCSQVLRTSPRTLQRALATEGTSFRQLLLGIRLELARQYLQDSNLGLAELAEMLGYRGQSAFTRAFKDAMGMAPRAWRRQQRPRS